MMHLHSLDDFYEDCIVMSISFDSLCCHVTTLHILPPINMSILKDVTPNLIVQIDHHWFKNNLIKNHCTNHILILPLIGSLLQLFTLDIQKSAHLEQFQK